MDTPKPDREVTGAHEAPRPAGRSINEIGAAILDTFYGSDGDAERHQQYLDRGIIPTNNLCLYISSSPGKPEYYDYSRHEFGPIFQALRDTQPELWAQVDAASRESGRLRQEYADLLFSGQSEAAAQK